MQDQIWSNACGTNSGQLSGLGGGDMAHDST